MAFKSLILGGSEPHIVGDDNLKNKITKLIANKYQRYPDFKKRLDQYKKTLLEHPYIHFDPHQAADHTYKCQRYNECKKKLNELISTIKEGEIKQIYPSETTGQIELTAQKLLDHSIKLLDISNDFVLIKLERHPSKGKGHIIHQYWLYSIKNVSLELLGADYEMRVEKGPWLTSSDGINWKPLGNNNELDYFEKIKQILGHKAIKRFKRLLDPQEIPLINGIPSFVDDKLLPSLGTKLSDKEKEALLQREHSYIAKRTEKIYT